MEDWLVRAGWSHSPDALNPRWAQYIRADGKGGVSVPLLSVAGDYARHLAFAIEEIADTVGLAPADLVTQMREGR